MLQEIGQLDIITEQLLNYPNLKKRYLLRSQEKWKYEPREQEKA